MKFEGWILYDYVYYIITTYFLPSDMAEYGAIWTKIIIAVSAVVTAIIMYVCIFRPFLLWIKWGMFGGRKSRRRKGDDE